MVDANPALTAKLREIDRKALYGERPQSKDNKPTRPAPPPAPSKASKAPPPPKSPPKPKQKGKAGRPTLFTQELADTICERLSKPESLRSICNDPTMPNRSTIARWMTADASFASMIAHAREIQADALADEAMAIADEAEGDVLESDGKRIPNNAKVARAKLQFEARRWYAGKLHPKKYSDKLVQEVTGKDGAALIPAEPQITDEMRVKALEAFLRRTRETTSTNTRVFVDLPTHVVPAQPENENSRMTGLSFEPLKDRKVLI